jgi:hypothetical protein
MLKLLKVTYQGAGYVTTESYYIAADEAAKAEAGRQQPYWGKVIITAAQAAEIKAIAAAKGYISGFNVRHAEIA